MPNTDGEVVQTNHGVRQGCALSPTLFNIYTGDIIRTWKSSVAPGIPLNINININILLFASDQIIIQSNDDDLQRSINLVDKLSLDYNMKMSITNTKSMAFKGKEPVRTNLVIDNKPIDQIQHFTYLGCDD